MKISVVLEDELFEWLKGEAEVNHRSLAGQIRFFLDCERQTKTDKAGLVAADAKGGDHGD